MTKSKARRKREMEFDRFHRNNNINECHDCGKNINGTVHHYYCPECHEKRKVLGLMTSPQNATVNKYGLVFEDGMYKIC